MTTPQLITAYIALGSNLGDRERNLRDALRALGANADTRVIRVSRLLKNPAVGGPADSPAFLNAVAEAATTLKARALLTRLLDIERGLGRTRRAKWEPRLIDLDLLLYGDAVISRASRDGDLFVPHPLMHVRRFVLEPLAELAPDLVHPTLHLPIRELLRRLP